MKRPLKKKRYRKSLADRFKESEMYMNAEIDDVIGEQAFERKSVHQIEKECGVNKWIPCSERLPENALDVLISDNIGHVEIGCCIHGKWYDYNVDEYGEQDENFNLKVVAWQPLPEPYCSMGENYGFPSKEEADLWMNSKPVGKEEI